MQQHNVKTSIAKAAKKERLFFIKKIISEVKKVEILNWNGMN
jgi:preprotein translocase subunit SecE